MMPRESEAQKFVDMVRVHREVVDNHGEDGTWQAVEFLAAHVGRLTERAIALDKRLRKLESKGNGGDVK